MKRIKIKSNAFERKKYAHVAVLVMTNENEKCLFSNTQEFLHNIFIKSFK